MVVRTLQELSHTPEDQKGQKDLSETGMATEKECMCGTRQYYLLPLYVAYGWKLNFF